MRSDLTSYAIVAAVLLAIAAMVAYTPTADAQVPVSTSANQEEYEYEWCPGTASTTYSGAPSTGARAVYIENRSSATCYVRFDATAVTTAGATGYKFASGTERSFDATHVFAGKMRAACTAATTTGACLYTSWWK